MAQAKYQIPKAVLDEHIIVLGKTRKGKSSVMRGAFIEPLLDDNKPVCIIDPKGDHWGLKLSASGQRAGYPVVIFGGDYADVPINEHSGKHVAELVATGNRPCIVDLGGWMVGARTRFFNDFASTFFRLNRGQRWLVIDEVHNFAPQGSTMRNIDRAMMVHWSNRLASEGLGRGINLIVASQRPQKVHKDLVTSCETLIAMGVNHPLDRDAIKAWMDGCGDPATGKEILGKLARLKKGEAFVWSPEIEYGPKRKQFKLFKTYDSFAPRRATQKKLKGWASINLDDVKNKLATVVAEAEANDPKALKRRIIELERVVAAGKKQKPTVDVKRIKELDDQRKMLAAKVDQASKSLDSLKARIQQVIDSTDDIEVPVVLPTATGAIDVDIKPRVGMSPYPLPTTSVNGLGRGETKILTTIAQHADGCDREQISVLTGYKQSSRNTYLQRLRSLGLIQLGPLIVATTKGLATLGNNFEPLPTGSELRNYWLQKLTGGEREILKVVVDGYPDALSRDDISELTNYKTSSRNTYLQRLRSRKLVIVAGSNVSASDKLF